MLDLLDERVDGPVDGNSSYRHTERVVLNVNGGVSSLSVENMGFREAATTSEGEDLGDAWCWCCLSRWAGRAFSAVSLDGVGLALAVVALAFVALLIAFLVLLGSGRRLFRRFRGPDVRGLRLLAVLPMLN